MSRYLKFTVQHVVGASRDKFRCTFGTEKYRHLMPVVGLLIGFASTFNSAAQDRIQGRALKQDSASGNRTIEPIRKSPKPLPAVPALLTLFDKYQVVGLSDLHGCADLLAFVAQLIRAPEFSAKVNDITWEPGNAMFQNLMDDFILRGKAIEFSQLAQCWRNNTQVHTYSDTPALFHLLQTVRKVNLALPEDRRVRVLLIDPPVDWSKIFTKLNLNAHDFDRETHMAKVIEREVYAKGRRALFFAGGAHLSRNGGPLQMLERSHPGTTVNIAIHEGFGQRTDELEQRLTAWPKPAIAFLHGTWWGSLNPAPTGDVFIRTDGKPIELRSDRKIEDNWDAVLYLEKRRNLTRVDPPGADILDAEWLAELRRRKAIVGGPDPSPELTGTKYSRQFFPDHPAPGDRIIRRRLDTNVQSQ